MEENDYKDKKQVKNKFIARLGKSEIWTIILVFVIFLCSLFASLIQNDWGQVDITTVYFEARDNQTVAYDIYQPKTVTEDNKAPLIVMIAGFQRSRETQGHVALELARRGFVVINIDPYNQGDSSSSQGIQGSAIATVEGYGSFDLIDYVYDHPEVYPFVDKTHIGVTGHSAGGNAAYQAAVHFGKDAVNNGGISKVHSVFISGYVLSIAADISYSKSNMGMDYALYDEGAFRNQVNPSAPAGTSLSDVTWMTETHDFVNSGLIKGGLPIIDYGTPLEIEKIYGNPNLGNMRQLFNTETIHAFQPYSTEATSKIIRYFEIALNFSNPDIGATDQVWTYKEALTTISLVASLSMLIPIASLFYRVPFFKSSKKDPIMITEKRSIKRLLVYIVVFIISAAFAALMYLPSSQLTFVLFPQASNSVNSWFFPQRMTNAVAIWAVLSGLFSALMFIISHLIFRDQKTKGTIETKGLKEEAKRWGVQMPIKDFFKTVLLGLLVIFIYFGFFSIIYGLFHVDYRLIFLMSARHINLKAVLQLLMYFPLFFIFYFSNSIRVNGSQMHGKLPEGIKLLLAGFMNIAGLAVILFVQYYAFTTTGTILFTELSDGTTQWLYVNILFTLLPVMFMMPFFNRWFYKLSGNSYLGPIIICAIFVLFAISNSVAYIPV